MPFSVPVEIGRRLEYQARISSLKRLTQFEYFDNEVAQTPEQHQRGSMAAHFRSEMEFAFFCVNFGMSKREYLGLTEIEKMFLRKQYENRIVETTTHMRNAVLNAEYNANRKKHAPFKDLFKKKPPKADISYNKNAMKLVEELEARDGKGWVDIVFLENANFLERLKPKPHKEERADGIDPEELMKGGPAVG